MEWHPFDSRKGPDQKLPTIKKYVLVLMRPRMKHMPCRIMIGYRKDAAGDEWSPYFATPGGSTSETKPPGFDPFYTDVLAWSDCLPSGFDGPRKLTDAI